MKLDDNTQFVYSSGKEIQKVYSLGKLVWEKKEVEPIDYSVMPFTIKAVEDNVKVRFNEFSSWVKDLKYKEDDGEWREGDTSMEFTLKKNSTLSVVSNYIIMHCNIERLADVYGNVMSLWIGDNFVTKPVWMPSYESSSAGLFVSSDIRNAENLILPATTLSHCCYRSMFSGCNNLKTAPKLPATTLAEGCYADMFYGCSSLTKAPELPAETLTEACYIHMFYGCSSLTKAPELPAETLTRDCYHYMFNGCSKLDYIKCHAVKTNNEWEQDVYSWLDGITTTGKLVCKQVDGGKNPLEDYIPDSWTVEYF